MGWRRRRIRVPDTVLLVELARFASRSLAGARRLSLATRQTRCAYSPSLWVRRSVVGHESQRLGLALLLCQCPIAVRAGTRHIEDDLGILASTMLIAHLRWRRRLPHSLLLPLVCSARYLMHMTTEEPGLGHVSPRQMQALPTLQAAFHCRCGCLGPRKAAAADEMESRGTKMNKAEVVVRSDHSSSRLRHHIANV